ncbi:MAG: hypothetical protein N3F03_06720 [Ignavibacteria bacterium]|nr:hypothetical protein [Ignavibacteria bacterium]
MENQEIKSALHKVLDAIDIETYIVCNDEKEAKQIALKLGEELNLNEVDIMYLEFDGYGARIRLRKYIHKPGNRYNYLNNQSNN